MEKLKFTVLSHTAPGQAPGKSYSVSPEGTLSKTTQGVRTEFRVKTEEVADLKGVAELFDFLTSTDHLTAGTPVTAEATAVTKEKLTAAIRSGRDKCDQGRPLITFSNTDLAFREGPGLMLIDTDGEQTTPPFEQLAKAVPALADYARLEASSSSSFIYTKDGKELNGLRGQHTFYAVADATDIPRALDVLHKRLVLAGFLRPVLSETGSFLERSAVDRQMRVPSQPIFVCAEMGSGLLQKKRVEYFDGKPILDTRAVLPDLTPEEGLEYLSVVAEARRKLLGESHAKRDAYIEARAKDMVKASGGSTTLAEAKGSLVMALGRSHLGPKHPITLADGSVVTVGEISQRREEFHKKRCRDPLEPTYGSATVAQIYTDGSTPVIFSHAHGGHTYRAIYEFPVWTEEAVAEELVRMNAADEALVAAMAGDPVTAAWLDAETFKGRQKVWTKDGEEEADAVACLVLKARLGIIPPDTAGAAPWDDVPDAKQEIPGLRFRKDAATKPGLVKLSSAGAEQFLRDWVKADKDEAIRRWPAVLGEHLACDGELDPVFGPVTKAAAKALGIGVAEAREALAAALRDHAVNLAVLTGKAIPSIPALPVHEPSPEEREADGLRAALAEEKELLERCRWIAENPLQAFDKAMQEAALAGERETALFCYLIIVSAHLVTPANGLTRGPSSSGKSYTMKAAARLFPGQYVYLLSSISPTALIYDKVGFKHRTLILEEAEVLVRSNAEDKNGIAEMLRVLLSERELNHKSVAKNPETGQFETQTYTVEGPTNLLTTTTRTNLDPEISTRMIDRYSDTTTAHAQDVLHTLGAKAAGDFADGTDLGAWHAFADLTRRGPHVVIVPFAKHLSKAFPTANGGRVFRDFNNMMSLTCASALVHRLHRKTDDRGRLIAEVEDYAVAYSILGERIDELSGEKVPDAVAEKFALLKAAMAAKCGAGIFTWQAGRIAVADALGCSKNSVYKELGRMESNGLISIERPTVPTRHNRTTLHLQPEADDILKGGVGLMTPAALKAELVKVAAEGAKTAKAAAPEQAKGEEGEGEDEI